MVGEKKTRKRWLQYTQSYPSKIRNTNKLATLNHNQRENSNLIMPFLVQNDNKMIKGLTTLVPKNAVHIPQMHKALFVLTIKYTEIEGKSFLQTDVSECA